jgi:hypothetical protein
MTRPSPPTSARPPVIGVRQPTARKLPNLIAARALRVLEVLVFRTASAPGLAATMGIHKSHRPAPAGRARGRGLRPTRARHLPAASHLLGQSASARPRRAARRAAAARHAGRARGAPTPAVDQPRRLPRRPQLRRRDRPGQSRRPRHLRNPGGTLRAVGSAAPRTCAAPGRASRRGAFGHCTQHCGRRCYRVLLTGSEWRGGVT